MHLLQGSSDGGHSLSRGECGIEIVGETELGPVLLSFSLNLVYLSVMCPQVRHRMVTFVLQPCLMLLMKIQLCVSLSLSHGLQEGAGWASYGKHESRFSP